MSVVKMLRRFACPVVLCTLNFMVIRGQVQAATQYFDINGTTAGSGVANNGSYSWESPFWTTDSTGASATGNWIEANFPSFSAGSDANGKTYTVTASSNHTVNGMQARAGVAGSVNTVQVQTAAGIKLLVGSGSQGFFSGANSNLKILGSLGELDATSRMAWQPSSGSLFLYGDNSALAHGVFINSSAGVNFNNTLSFGTTSTPINLVDAATETALALGGTAPTTFVLANPDTTASLTMSNPVQMRSDAASTVILTGHDTVTWTNWTLGTGQTGAIQVANSTFPNASVIMNNLAGSANSNLTVQTPVGVNGVLQLTGTSTYGGITTIGQITGTVTTPAAPSTATPVLQADEGAGLTTNIITLNGGVLQTSGTFNRVLSSSIGVGSNDVAWHWPTTQTAPGGGGFSAIGSQLTVNINGDGSELTWGDTSGDVGSKILGPLKLGSASSNAKTLWTNPIDLNSSGTTGLTRTITPSMGLAGSSTEINSVIRNSAADTDLQISGTGTLLLTGTNTYSGNTKLSAGALQAVAGVGLPTGHVLILDGGIDQEVDLSGNSTSFTRPIGTTANTVEWTANGGGFSAINVQRTVNIGGASAEIAWGDAPGDVGTKIVGPLIFGSNTANNKVLFVNGIDLNSSATTGLTRTVTVNTGAGGDSAEMGGVLRNSGAATALAKNGAGTLTLSGANTYSGGTTISAGTLALGNIAALPTTGLVTLGGGTLSNVSGGGITAPNAVSITANSTLAGSNSFNFTGSITNSAANRTLTVSNTGGTTFATVDLSEASATGRTLTLTGAGNVTLGVIENVAGGGGTAGSLTFNGTYTGTATINGTGTYSGTTTLSAGTYVLGNKAAFGTSTVALNGVSVSANTDLSGANAIANATVNLGGNNTFTGSNNIQFSGTVTATGSRTVTNNLSGANLTLSGPVNLSSNATSNTVTVAGTGNTSITGVIANGGTATASKLTKSGNGTLTLTNANTYAGVTTISGGTLLANNASGSATGTGAVTVAGSGTLGGTGTIGGAITNNGTLSPGVGGVGTLSTTGNFLDGASSIWNIDLSGATADKLAVTGNIDLTAVDTLNVLGAGTGTSWLIGTYTGTETGAFDTITAGYTVTYTGGNITLNAVPACAPGDLNCDGHTDAGDYVFWRKNGGTPNDANYIAWRTNFGTPPGAGSGAGLAGATVPEPSSIALLICGLAVLVGLRRDR